MQELMDFPSRGDDCLETLRKFRRKGEHYTVPELLKELRALTARAPFCTTDWNKRHPLYMPEDAQQAFADYLRSEGIAKVAFIGLPERGLALGTGKNTVLRIAEPGSITRLPTPEMLHPLRTGRIGGYEAEELPLVDIGVVRQQDLVHLAVSLFSHDYRLGDMHFEHFGRLADGQTVVATSLHAVLPLKPGLIGGFGEGGLQSARRKAWTELERDFSPLPEPGAYDYASAQLAHRAALGLTGDPLPEMRLGSQRSKAGPMRLIEGRQGNPSPER